MISALTPKELMNYAEPATELEKRLYDAALTFQSEAADAESELNDHIRQFEHEESEAVNELQDEIDDIKLAIKAALSAILSGKTDEGVEILKELI